MLNRYFLLGRVPPLITIITVSIVLIASVHQAQPYPAQRRTFSLVDRLIRANPFRALTNLFNRKLTMDLYYPPPPGIPPQMHPIPLPIRDGGGGGGSSTSSSSPTHYVKMPTSWQPIYYMPMMPAAGGPALTMTTTAMLAPVTRQPPAHLLQKSPQPYPYLLHGVSYPVENPQAEQQHHFVQPAMSTYQQQPVPLAPATQSQFLGQSESPGPETNYLNYVASSSGSGGSEPPPPIQVPAPGQVESPPSPSLIHSDYSEHGQPSGTIADTNYLLLNEKHPVRGSSLGTVQLQQQEIPNPPQFESHTIVGQDPAAAGNTHDDGDASPVGNSQSIKIVVIRPSDLHNMRKMEEELAKGGEILSVSAPDMVKDYTMKYVELRDNHGGASEDDQPKFILDSDSNDQYHFAPVDGEGENPAEESSICVEPMCDPFLKKLIPELLASHQYNHAGSAHNEQQPIVIVKSDNDTVIPVDYSISFLPNDNYRVRDSSHDEDHITLIQSMDDPLEGQQSSPVPKRVHFPRKKLISAKINSTALRKHEPKSRKQPTLPSSSPPSSRQTILKLHKNLHKLANNRNRRLKSVTPSSKSSPSETVIPKPRIFQVERSYPSYRYGSKAMRNLNEGLITRAKKTAHYTAGIVFNKAELNSTKELN